MVGLFLLVSLVVGLAIGGVCIYEQEAGRGIGIGLRRMIYYGITDTVLIMELPND